MLDQLFNTGVRFLNERIIANALIEQADYFLYVDISRLTFPIVSDEEFEKANL
jgi:hypothetical protein